VLERIGTIPSHRKGISALYARHLREVTGTGSRRRFAPSDINSLANSQNELGTQPYPEQPMIQPFDAQSVQFSAMSDDQITRAIMNAEDMFDASLPNFQIDEWSGLEWEGWLDL
jgi:hypothetical protein